MKKLFTTLSIALGVFALANTASAQSSATNTQATASATIFTPISIARVNDMNFGNVVSSATTGTVVLPAGSSPTRTVTGGATIPPTTGTVTAAQFTVSGQSGAAYTITLPAGNVVLNGSVSGTMNVNTFTSSPATNAGVLTGGSQTLYVGATLNVGANQAPGVYTSSAFPVTVAYN